MKLSAIVLSLVATASSALELTPDNWDDATAGKTIFVKFLAPWWGHCKKMKPDWDKLMAEFADSATQLVADVDCTTEGKPLCDANGVRGYPTIKWGDPSDLQDYQGGRDFNSLKKFAEENLKPVCSPVNIDLCDDDKKKQIEEFMAMSDDDMEAKIKGYEEQMEKAEEDFKEAVTKLQNEYQKLSADKDAALAAVKEAGLGLLKSVKAAKAKKDKDEL